MALEEGSGGGRDAADNIQHPPPGQATAGLSHLTAKLSNSS